MKEVMVRLQPEYYTEDWVVEVDDDVASDTESLTDHINQLLEVQNPHVFGNYLESDCSDSYKVVDVLEVWEPIQQEVEGEEVPRWWYEIYLKLASDINDPLQINLRTLKEKFDV